MTTVDTKRTMNEQASDYCSTLWREYFKTKEGKKILEQAKQAEKFLERLGKETSR